MRGTIVLMAILLTAVNGAATAVDLPWCATFSIVATGTTTGESGRCS